jgi:hypothetical protein
MKAKADCPSFHDHTPCPDGYIQWHAWARRMMRTHRQIRCTGCGLLSIWIPRKSLTEKSHGSLTAPKRTDANPR